MAMSLVQPPVGSVGWGDSVNLNFQTLEQFCNGLPGNLADGSIALSKLEAGATYCALGANSWVVGVPGGQVLLSYDGTSNTLSAWNPGTSKWDTVTLTPGV
jgi:hypothetical protein